MRLKDKIISTILIQLFNHSLSVMVSLTQLRFSIIENIVFVLQKDFKEIVNILFF